MKKEDIPVNPKRRQTKVNLWLAALIVVFYVLGGVLIYTAATSPEPRDEVLEVGE